MKVGARVTFELGGKRYDFVSPSLIQIRALFFFFTARHDVEEFMKEDEPYELIDIGANIGSWSIPIASRFPKAHVTCFEPIEKSFQCLVYNTKNSTNITCVKLALGSENGTATLRMPTDDEYQYVHDGLRYENNFGVMSKYASGGDEEQVQVRVLDELWGDKPVHLIKMDIEGMETEALMGMKNILKNQRPLLQVELQERNQKRLGKTAIELVDFIRSFGYQGHATTDGDGLFVPKERADESPRYTR